MSGLGDELRSAREARRLSLADVSEQIHIRSVYLQALEDENWTAISAPVYVRGFLRTYARFLGLDGDAAVERFSVAAGVPTVATPPAVPEPPQKASVLPTVVAPPPATKPRRESERRREGNGKRLSPFVWLAAWAAALLVAFVCYKFYEVQNGEQAAVVAAAPSQAPRAVASRPPTPAPTRIPERTLALRVTERSWIHVDIDGKPALEGIFEKGWAREFHGDTASVSVGNAGGVDVSVNGREQGPMGASGDVVSDKRFPLNADAEHNGRG